MATYFTLLTKTGQALLATANATGAPVQLTHMAVGDGNGVEITPQESQTALIREVWRGSLNSLDEDTENPGWIKAEAVIPESQGGFTIREVGLFDTNGLLVAVGNLPSSYKPQLAEGSAKTFYMRMRVSIGNANSVTLLIDPSVILAPRSYVDVEVGKVRTDLDALSDAVETHIDDHANPHETTASQVGAEPAGAVAAHDADEESHADIRALIAGMSGARYETLPVGAGAMIPSRTNGATAGVDETATYKLTEEYMSFGNAADTSAEFSCKLPENWDRGTVKVRIHWRPAGGTAGQVVGFQVAAGVSGDGDTLDRALGEAVTVSDAARAGLGNEEHATAASTALTVGGIMAAGKRLHFKITRDYDYAVGGAALAAAALLLGIEIQYRTSGSVAAWI